MSAFSARRRRALIGSSGLAAGLLAGSLAAPAGHADLTACRTDPVVYLSNGTELDLSATVNANSADVQRVTFTLHAPVGTQVVAYVGGALGTKEAWQFYADNPPGAYDTITVATTNSDGVGVSTTVQALGFLSPKLVTVSGESNQEIRAHLSL